MDTTLSLISPAKLNLFLHINGQRPNGYHELQTVFQILDRGDTLHFELTESPEIKISPIFKDIPLENNLVYRAAKLLQDTEPYLKNTSSYKGINKGAKIHLEKTLPLGGGIGGGSSNAATTLLALNQLWELDFTLPELAAFGASLGADVPVFVHGKSAWAEGIGDVITPILLPESWFVIITPDCHVSTAEIFSNERLTRDTPKMRIAAALEGQATNHFYNGFTNDCESLVLTLYPQIQKAISLLNKFGKGRLTGTGACCFARFNSEEKAQQVLNKVSAEFKGFIAKGVNLSPAFQKLNKADSFAKNET
ncbi:MAG: 4-diphosphocytidyl-2-C-methyl-D-erythritol kinase [Pseudohongiellaceae bacterium]|jgi:4-diphosphocytidyl-2-C-methyl-D-erythritol kinase